MFWSNNDYSEEDENLLYSPALMARRASESWIDTLPEEEDTHTLSSLQRKKSLPDFQGQPPASTPMSREEVSLLSSARREEMRRLQEENERLRANPFLYLVSPHVKDWFSRQQLLMVILFINISLAIIFFKLLTS